MPGNGHWQALCICRQWESTHSCDYKLLDPRFYAKRRSNDLFNFMDLCHHNILWQEWVHLQFHTPKLHITSQSLVNTICILYTIFILWGAVCSPGSRRTPEDCWLQAEVPRSCRKQGEEFLLLFSAPLLRCSAILEPNEFIWGYSLCGKRIIPPPKKKKHLKGTL